MKHLIYTLLIIFLSANLFAKANISELISEENLICAEDALKLLENYRVSEALTVSNFCQDPAIEKMIIWLSLYDNYVIEPKRSMEFLINHKNFPAQDRIRKIMERNISKKIPTQHILKFYNDDFPHTEKSFQLFLQKSLENINSSFQEDIKTSLQRKYFLHNNFPEKKLDHYINDNLVNKNIIILKINNLLRDKQVNTAKKLLKYLHLDYQYFFKARIALIENQRKALKKIKTVTPQLQNNADFIFDLVNWYERHDEDDKIYNHISKLNYLENPEKWHNKRIRNARYLLKKQKYQEAYEIVANHQITKTNHAYIELEWFSGWLALRFLQQPELAIKHFKRMYNNVKFAISLSRGAYWIARAYDASLQFDLAKKWYQEASNYNSTYYGQMALLELEKQIMIKLPKFHLTSAEELQNYIKTQEKARIALYFSALKKDEEAELFFKNLIIKNEDEQLISMIISLSSYSNNQEIINKIARYATRFNVITLANYPLINNLPSTYNVGNYALIMSIIKQESGFSNNAVSKAGAVGFMQLMPATAKQVAKKLNIKYNKNKLQTNAKYNITLGAYYINSLLKKFNNSYIVAIASYNAGPKNTKRWLKENGDPRQSSDIHQAIDWVEQITFSETRNYVQRIIENSVIYQHLLNQKIQEFPVPKLKPSN